jgi:hypothetical protein
MLLLTVELVSAARPPLPMPPPYLPALPLTVELFSVSVLPPKPPLSMPPPPSLAEFPLTVESFSVSVPS